MKGSRLLVTASLIALFGVSSAAAQDATMELLWSGLFGPYSRHPLPNDPLPDVTLSPYGEIARPLLRTDRVPAKLGTRFGLLVSFHGSKGQAKGQMLRVRYVTHVPPPGIPEGIGQVSGEKIVDDVSCLIDLPCYLGYRFEHPREMVPGEWGMTVLLGDDAVHEARFIVEQGRENAI